MPALTGYGAALRVAASYVVLGLVWSAGSDWLVSVVCAGSTAQALARTATDWTFVGATGVLLYLLVRRDLDAREEARRSIEDVYRQTIHGWLAVIDRRHHETGDHTERVTRMTLGLARAAGIRDPEELERIEWGAMLHDLGKVGIPDAILLKPGRLDPEEMAVMREHPTIAHHILTQTPFLQGCMDIPWCHHERWDGAGYPRGLRGEEIPYNARLFAIVDVWDALIQRRLYKAPWSREEVVAYLQEQAGHQFDPEVVALFLANYDQLAEA